MLMPAHMMGSLRLFRLAISVVRGSVAENMDVRKLLLLIIW